MAQYLLDTNHLSPLITPGHSLRLRIFNALAQQDTFCIPTPVLTEFLFGIRLLPRAQQNLSEWALLHNQFDYYDVTCDVATAAAELRVSLCKTGRQLEIVDGWIATIALQFNFILLTTDGDFQWVTDLQHQNWMRQI